MAFYYVTQPRRSFYQPPTRWALSSEYDPFDLFSEFIGHHPTSLLGCPGFGFAPSLYLRAHPAQQQKPQEEQRWHKIVKLPPYFGPEDFMVKTEGNTLLIHAKHEDKDEEGGSDVCEVTRRVVVPEQVDMDTVRTLWLKRGGVMVVGQLKSQEEPKPVEQKKPEEPKPEQQPMEVQQPTENKDEKPTVKREMSIDPENFVTEMRSFAQDVHEALFGQGLPVPDPQAPIPMEEGKGESGKEDPDEPGEVRLDVTGYKPEEIKVAVENNMVNVEASHLEEDDDHTALYQFQRSFSLPKGAIPTKVSHKIDPEKNQLVITMPSEKLAIEDTKAEA